MLDKLCGFIETLNLEASKKHGIEMSACRGPDSLYGLVKRARLFHVPEPDKTLAFFGLEAKVDNDLESADIDDRLLRPFDDIIIEDDNSLCAISFVAEDGVIGVKNFDKIQWLIARQIPHKDVSSYGFDVCIWGPMIVATKDRGLFVDQYSEFFFQQTPCIVAGYTSRKKRIETIRFVNEPQELADICGKYVVDLRYYLRLLRIAMHPRTTLVEKTEIHAPPVLPGKLARSIQRPRIILLTKTEVSRLLNETDEETGRHLASGHRRRACWHTLKDPRFRFKAGQRVPVKSCWVGPRTGIDGGERYEVLVDIPSMEIGGE